MGKLIHAVAIIFTLSPVTHPLAWWVHAWLFLLVYYFLTEDDPKAMLFDMFALYQQRLWWTLTLLHGGSRG